MKTITKISALVAALLMLLCFVSCEQNASSSSPNLVASFNGTMNSNYGSMKGTLLFYDDSSFKFTAENDGFTGGKYTGDVTKDGDGTLSFEGANTDMEWSRSGDTLELKINVLGIYVPAGTFQKQ